MNNEKMKKMRKIIFLASLMLGLVCGSLRASDTTEDTSKYDSLLVKAGTQAPDFTITNAQYPKGIRLSSFRGRYVVLDFWASWCPDCRKDVPALVELHKKYAARGVTFVSVSFDTDAARWQKFVADNGMTWIQYSELKKWKKETTIDSLYRVNWIPTTYLIDREGRIVLGTVDINKLAKALEDIR